MEAAAIKKAEFAKKQAEKKKAALLAALTWPLAISHYCLAARLAIYTGINANYFFKRAA